MKSIGRINACQLPHMFNIVCHNFQFSTKMASDLLATNHQKSHRTLKTLFSTTCFGVYL